MTGRQDDSDNSIVDISACCGVAGYCQDFCLHGCILFSGAAGTGMVPSVLCASCTGHHVQGFRHLQEGGGQARQHAFSSVSKAARSVSSRAMWVSTRSAAIAARLRFSSAHCISICCSPAIRARRSATYARPRYSSRAKLQVIAPALRLPVGWSLWDASEGCTSCASGLDFRAACGGLLRHSSTSFVTVRDNSAGNKGQPVGSPQILPGMPQSDCLWQKAYAGTAHPGL